MKLSRRKLLMGSGLLASSTSLANPAIGQNSKVPKKELIMVTSWPKNSPGPATTAERFVKRVEQASQGLLSIKIFASGEMVPPHGVFDAVRSGIADVAHTASFFWQGKLPAAAFFTAIPFGLRPSEHQAWLHHGGGLELWQELYKPSALVPISCGNTGFGMGGWFRKPVLSHDDLIGLKYRMPGIGGLVFKELGCNVVDIPPAEIYAALANGVIDGAEFLGPWSDFGFGFFKHAPYYAYPGFHEPNGSSELLINADTWQALSPSLRLIIKEAARLADTESLTELYWNNALALQALQKDHKVQIFAFPADILSKARSITHMVLHNLGAGDPVFKKILASYKNALSVLSPWANVAERSFLNAR